MRLISVGLLSLSLALTSHVIAQESSGNVSRKLVERTQPSYPTLARRNGLVGTVKLKVLIAPDGHPKDVEVVGGNPVFVNSATDSVKKWKWSTADHESTEVVEVKFDSGT